MIDAQMPNQSPFSYRLETMTLTNAVRPFWSTACSALLLAAVPSMAFSSDWNILSVNGLPAIGEPHLSLGEDGTIAGNTGCNSFQGTAKIQDEAVFVSGPMAITTLACPGDGLAEQEQSILRVLQGDTSFTHNPFSGAYGMNREGDALQLTKFDATVGDAKEQARLVFEAPYLNVYGLKGPLNVRQGPATNTQVVTRVLAGTLLRNEGCTAQEDRVWCNVTFLDASGTTGWAAADYLQPAPATVRAKEGLFDNIGRLPCVFTIKEDADLCEFGVARDGQHSAVAVIYKPDGSERFLSFAEGALVYAELASDEAVKPIETSVSAGAITVTLGEEHYEIPQNIVLGTDE